MRDHSRTLRTVDSLLLAPSKANMQLRLLQDSASTEAKGATTLLAEGLKLEEEQYDCSSIS